MPVVRLLFIVASLIGAGWGLYERQRKQQNVSADVPPTAELQPDIPSIIVHLRHGDWQVRVEAVNRLSSAGDPALAPYLLDLLDDPDSDVRDAVVAALSQYGHSVADGVCASLESSSQDARIAAAQVLGHVGSADSIPDLIAVLQNDVSAWVRIAAAEALGEIRQVRAVPALIKAMTDTDSTVRKTAKDALIRIGTPEALKALAN